MTAVAAEQREIVAFLERPQTYGTRDPVERIDTHISHVFLAGARAYKLKRAVKFPYVDFSTRELRHRYALAEVALNRRTAPQLYLGVMPVKRAAGGLALGAMDENGDALDWLVVMRRFGQDRLLDALARAGKLTRAIAAELAEEIAAFHAKAEPAFGYGGRDAMESVALGNLAEIRKHTPGIFPPDKVVALDRGWAAALDAVGPLLDRRRQDGKVRRCHGDLHLRNICLIDDKPTLFDAIEFSAEFASIDLLYDLAFLLMDMVHRDLGDLANLVLNTYLSAADDYGGIAALPFFLSCRAGVRAHVAAAANPQAPDEPRAYLDLAQKFLAPTRPALIAIGGLSGTGKTTVALGLAPALDAPPGAVVLRSDLTRKRLAGVHPLTRLPADAYTEAETARVYDRLIADARTVLAGGRGVIVDAMFARPEQRAALAAVARAAGVPFAGLWLETSPETRRARIGARTHDASDATADLVTQQEAYDIDPLDWPRIEAGADLERTIERARKALADQLH